MAEPEIYTPAEVAALEQAHASLVVLEGKALDGTPGNGIELLGEWRGTKSGVSVSTSTAMQIAAVMACADAEPLFGIEAVHVEPDPARPEEEPGLDRLAAQARPDPAVHGGALCHVLQPEPGGDRAVRLPEERAAGEVDVAGRVPGTVLHHAGEQPHRPRVGNELGHVREGGGHAVGQNG